MTIKDVVFLRADGQPDKTGEFFSMDSNIEIKDKLEIWTDELNPRCFGWADNIRRVDSLFVADIHISRFITIPVEVYRHLTLAVKGTVKFRDNQILKDINVTSLMLTPYNADKRIKNLGAYGC